MGMIENINYIWKTHGDRPKSEEQKITFYFDEMRAKNVFANIINSENTLTFFDLLFDVL